MVMMMMMMMLVGNPKTETRSCQFYFAPVMKDLEKYFVSLRFSGHPKIFRQNSPLDSGN